VSAIDSVSSNSAGAASSSTSGADITQLSGTKDEFLKLFMAQLQNQDPLSPKDGSDMVAQLAQFSSVEQAQQTNQQLSALTATEASTANASLSSLVGRQCSATVGDVNVEDSSKIPPINVSSSSAINNASIVIKDANGKEIRRIAIPATGGNVQWDGKDANGAMVPPGAYNVSVDSGTSTSTVNAAWQDRISSVELGTTGSRLQMDGITISPSSITSIGATNTTDVITTAINASAAGNASTTSTGTGANP
jgi:flagellar basal-body rod modification protein FlgD